MNAVKMVAGFLRSCLHNETRELLSAMIDFDNQAYGHITRETERTANHFGYTTRSGKVKTAWIIITSR